MREVTDNNPPCLYSVSLDSPAHADQLLMLTSEGLSPRETGARGEGEPTNLAVAANSWPMARNFMPTSSLNPFSSSSLALTISTTWPLSLL